jgi:acetyl-CoA carboxylase carboxyl transferase subunit beta
MLTKNLFKKPKNTLETNDKYTKDATPDIPNEMCVSCPSCKTILLTGDLNDNLNICTKCGHHFRINARQPHAKSLAIDRAYNTGFTTLLDMHWN